MSLPNPPAWADPNIQPIFSLHTDIGRGPCVINTWYSTSDRMWARYDVSIDDDNFYPEDYLVLLDNVYRSESAVIEAAQKMVNIFAHNVLATQVAISNGDIFAK